MEQLTTSLKTVLGRLGPAKLAGLGVAAVSVLLCVIWLASRTTEPMGLLYAGLDPGEAGRIAQRLDELKVPYEAKGDGSSLMVPVSQVGRARMDLAASGLPRQGGPGYELLDTQSPMNMTSFMQRIQRVRALEGELARSIATLDGVLGARVHIVLPERETFSRETPKSTASVAVTMRGPGRFSSRQAAAVRLLVAGAVPGLRQEDVSVLDPSGVVLAADDAEEAASSHLEDLKAAREQALQRAVTGLLEPLVGAGHLKTVVSLELDPSREVSHEEKFDPLSQVERSRHTQNDKESAEEARNTEGVTVTQNVPGEAQPGEPGKTANTTSRAGETVNYELNSVRSEKVREPGELKRLTVAVLVDGATDANGQFHPRAKEELDRIGELVRSAVGFDAKRGDKVTVDTMQFLPAPPQLGESSEAGESGASSWLIYGGIGVAVILVVGVGFFFLRGRMGPAVDRVNAALPASLPSTGGQPALATSEEEQLLLTNEQNSAVAMLNDVFDSNPDEALALIRGWIAESAAV
jgi:flagellar M-ring protein FliF